MSLGSAHAPRAQDAGIIHVTSGVSCDVIGRCDAARLNKILTAAGNKTWFDGL